ncbi:MAG: YfhO family protein [Candidatus Sumerlaeaceae bacterium]|nr:YfhO family protein [Candidatus Sumerlaeaceae bacterium]
MRSRHSFKPHSSQNVFAEFKRRSFDFLHNRSPWLPYGVVCLFSVAMFGPSLPYLSAEFLGHYAADMNIAYRHYLTFAVRWLRTGIIAQWNPHIFCGTQFLPSTCATIHHPLNALLLSALPLPFAANAIIILHVMLLGCAVSYWSRTLSLSPPAAALAGVLAVSSSAVVGRVFAGHFTIVSTLPWAIWFLASVHKLIRQAGRGWLGTGILGAIMFLGGHLQTSYYALLMSGVVAVATMAEMRTISRFASWKRALTALVGAWAISMGLAAIELVPVAEALRYSARVSTTDTSWIRRFSLPVENLALLVLPNGLGSPLEYMGRWFWWEASPTTSVAGIIMALGVLLALPERKKALIVPLSVVVVAAFLSIAPNWPMLSDVLRLLPGWSALRGHAKIFAYALCVLPILTASGVEAFFADDQRVRKGVWGASLLLGLVALLVAAGAGDSTLLAYAKSETVLKDRLFGPSPMSDTGTRLVTSSLHRAAWHTVVVCFLLVGITLLTRFLRQRYVLALTAILFAFESFFLAGGVANNHFVPEENKALTDFATQLAAKADMSRVEVVPDGLVNAAMTYRLTTPGGNDVNVSQFFDSFVAAAEGMPSAEPHLHVRATFPSPLWDYAALRYLLIPKEQRVREELGLKQVTQLGNYTVWERESAYPFAHVAQKITWIDDKEDEIFRVLSNPNLNPLRDGTFLIGRPRSVATDARVTTNTEIPISRPNPMTLVMQVPFSGVVVVAEGYSPHWRAYDERGEGLAIYRANGAFLGVVVEKPMRLTLQYVNPFFFFGRLISLVTLGCALVMVVYSSAKTRPLAARNQTTQNK